MAGNEESDLQCKIEDSVVQSKPENVIIQLNLNEDSDPYAYTRRHEFTSENFKIELKGLPKYYQFAELKKLLNGVLQLSAHKIKPAGRGNGCAFVNFRSEEDREKATGILNGYKWKKGELSVKNALPAQDPLIRTQLSNMVSKDQDNLTIEEKMTKCVTPFAHLPYEEQLKLKERKANDILRKYGNEIPRVNRHLSSWVSWQKQRRRGLVCQVDPIIASPVTENYRNKCEFTIGMNPELNLVTVGFRVSSYREGSISVGPVGHLRHLPQQMKLVVEVFERYLQASVYKPFNPMNHEGVWRQLTVRTTENDDILIVVVIHPQQLTENELDDLKTELVNLFTTADGKHVGVTAIFLQKHAQKTSGEDLLEHLWGKTSISETILGRKFRISPKAFLQVNTAAAEQLYKMVGTICDLDSESDLVDICCGTGTIGISLAEKCHKVVGLELVSEAVEDARLNAKMNGMDNVIFHCGRAEELMMTLICDAEKRRTVAVVDPPRAGLHTNVIVALRKAEYINRIVFISCDPNLAYKNFIALSRPKSNQYNGECFVPIRAMAVDLFPHTPHSELLILFERWDPVKWKHIMDGNPLPNDVQYFREIPPLVTSQKRVHAHQSASNDDDLAECDAKKPHEESDGKEIEVPLSL